METLMLTKRMAKAKGKAGSAAKPKVKASSWVNEVLAELEGVDDKNDPDLLGLDEAPEWVMKALVESVGVAFPSGLPSTGEGWDAKLLGEVLGRLHVVGDMVEGKIPLGPETEADMRKALVVAAKLPPPKNGEALEKEWVAKRKAFREAIPQATAAAMSASHADAVNFQKGLSRGLEIKPDEMSTASSFERHTRTYWTLAILWRTWVKCRSLRQVHEILCKARGESRIGNFKRFEKICKRIGFKLRGPGRPKAVK